MKRKSIHHHHKQQEEKEITQPSKKQKLNNDDTNNANNSCMRQIEKLFKHKDDKKQCKQIYDNINNNKHLINDLDQPLINDIVLKISEMAIGIPSPCANKDCSEQIYFLAQELLQDMNDQFWKPVQCPNPDCGKLLYGRVCNVSKTSQQWHWCTTECEVGDFCDQCLIDACVFQHLKNCGQCKDCSNDVRICNECFDSNKTEWNCNDCK